MAVVPMSPFTDPSRMTTVTTDRRPLMGRVFTSPGNRRTLRYSRRFEGMPAIQMSPMASSGGASQGPGGQSPDRMMPTGGANRNVSRVATM